MHNARNRALWGVWRTDDWNPVYIAPVFTALEYVAFRDIRRRHSGRRARCRWPRGSSRSRFSMAGLAAVANRRAAAHRRRAARDQLRLRDVEPRGAHGIDDDRVHRRRLGRVRAGRAPAGLGRRRGRRGGPGVVHESVGGVFRRGDCARRAEDDRPLAGAGAAGTSRRRRARANRDARGGRHAREPRGGRGRDRRAVRLAALDGVRLLQLADVRASANRRTTSGDFIDRASWLPIVQAIFMRMWLVRGRRPRSSMLAIVARWRTARPAERLLVLWMLLGLARARRARLGQRAALRDVHSRDDRAGRDAWRAGRRQFFRQRLAALGRRAPAGAAPAAVPRIPGDRQRCCGRCFSADIARPIPSTGSSCCRPASRRRVTRVRAVAVAARRRLVRACGPCRGRWCSRLAGGRARLERASSTRVGPRTAHELNYQASVALGRLAAAGHARAGQARQRAGARQPDPADLHRQRLRQLRRSTASATTCAIY